MPTTRSATCCWYGHRSADPARRLDPGYRYDEPSLLEPGRHGNRLTGTGPARERPPPQRFGYDEHGNMTVDAAAAADAVGPRRPAARHRPAGRVSGGVPETTYYVYDAAGQRVRKVTDARPPAAGQPASPSGSTSAPSRSTASTAPDGTVTLERETLHVLDDKRRVALVETRTAGTIDGPGELIRYQFANHLGSSVLELDAGRAGHHLRGVLPVRQHLLPGRARAVRRRRSATATPARNATGDRPLLSRRPLLRALAGPVDSRRPGGMADGPNLYSYARCNPVRMVDLDGKQGSEPEFFDKYTPLFAPSPLLRFDLSADPSAITARFLGDAAVALGTHTEITGPNAGRPDFFLEKRACIRQHCGSHFLTIRSPFLPKAK